MNSYYEARDRRAYYKTIAKSLTGDRYPNISVLDLASGGHCILEEIVRDKARYQAIEIRRSNVKTLQAQLSQLSPIAHAMLGDAVYFTDYIDNRMFDIIFVAGLLYHLNVPDQVSLLDNVVRQAGTGAVLCTVFSGEVMNTAPTYYAHDGYIFEARTYYEHDLKDSDNLIESRLRASFQMTGDRYPSCALTEDSMVRLIRKLGCDMVQRYRMSPMVGDVPNAHPPNTGDRSKPFTALMNSERGTLIISLGPGLLKPPRPCGTMIDTSRDSNVPLTSDELTSLRDSVCIHLKRNRGNMLEAAHQAAHMLPLSMHHQILLGALDAGVSLSDILELRVYLESYLRVCNDKRAQEASFVITAYHEYLVKESVPIGRSILETVRNYLWQYLPPAVRETVNRLYL